MRFLIIGYGSIGKRHANNLINIHKKSKIFIISRQKIIKNKQEKKFHFLKFNNLNKFTKETFDAIFICSGANEHLMLINKFFNTTNNIFVEKPLSYNTKKVQNTLKKIRYSKKFFLVGYNLLFSKSLIYLKKIIRRKKKKIIKVTLRTGYDLRKWRNVDYKKTVSADKRKGGGVLLELSHDLNNLIWLFGKPVWVSAHISKISDLRINTEDNVFMVVGFKNTIVNINLDFLSKNYQRYMTFYMKDNTLTWSHLTNSIKQTSKNSKKMKIIYKSKQNLNDLYIDELNFFLKNKNYRKFNSLAKISYQTLELIKAAKLSNQKKSTQVRI